MAEPLAPDASVLSLHVLPAEHGDCSVLSYGDAHTHYRLVVDTGVAATSSRLRHVMQSSAEGTVWELLVVTHIDDDHIGGASALLSDVGVMARFQDIWFNGRQHLDPAGTEVLGVRQGIQLQEALGEEGVPWNRAFSNGAVCIANTGPLPSVTLGSGAKLTILSPDLAALSKLRTLWDRHLRLQQQNQAGASSQTPPPAPPGFHRLGGGALNIPALAATNTQADLSIPNGSSIAFIFEYAGKRILFGADAHADILERSAPRLPGSPPHQVDLFKLPHHASSRNVTRTLLKAYPTKRYVVSTNGARHDHPDDIALARVVLESQGAKVFFNYPSEAFSRWERQAMLPESHFSVEAGDADNGVLVKLLKN